MGKLGNGEDLPDVDGRRQEIEFKKGRSTGRGRG